MQVQHRTAPSWTSSVSPRNKQRRPEAASGSLSSPRRRDRGGRCKESTSGGVFRGGSCFLKKERKIYVRPAEMILYFQLAQVRKRKDSPWPDASTASPPRALSLLLARSLSLSPVLSLSLSFSAASSSCSRECAVSRSADGIYMEGWWGGGRERERERDG